MSAEDHTGSRCRCNLSRPGSPASAFWPTISARPPWIGGRARSPRRRSARGSKRAGLLVVCPISMSMWWRRRKRLGLRRLSRRSDPRREMLRRAQGRRGWVLLSFFCFFKFFPRSIGFFGYRVALRRAASALWLYGIFPKRLSATAVSAGGARLASRGPLCLKAGMVWPRLLTVRRRAQGPDLVGHRGSSFEQSGPSMIGPASWGRALWHPAA